ncbi:MAG TPA: VTT domain-containing protein [Bryobacteraceae bacterium]|jgi:membrane protein YqaA with SNARE-associated domain|nr:VTT domain-containing protein [Bryobacteraceae bacterium]
MIGGVDVLIILIAAVDHAQAYWAAGTAVAGSLIGCLLLFLVARKGGEAYLRRRTISLREARFRAWFHEYGLLTVFIPAFVPIPLPLKIFIVSAGALEASPLAFTLVMFAARIPRYLFLAWLGTRLGKETLPYLRQHAWQFSLLAIVLFGLLYLAIRFLHNRHLTKPAPMDPA